MKAELSQIGMYLAPHYSGVFQQQGRMLVDRDWNELCEILRHLGRVAALEAIGTGVPRHGGMIASPAPGALGIANAGGLVAADGAIGEVLPRAPGNLYLNQRDLPATLPNPAGKTLTPPMLDVSNSPPPIDLAGRTVKALDTLPLLSEMPTGQLLYVDLWDRMVNAFEAADLVDPALHGADTCVRTQRMAQIKAATPADVDRLDPCAPLLSLPQKGDATFTASPTPAGDAADDCDPCADQVTITRSVPNRLFRLEVHSVTFSVRNPTVLLLKWSLDNGAREFKAADYATQADATKHSYEFFSSATEQLLGMPSDDWPAEALLRGTLDPADPVGAAAPYPRVREWDGWCQLSLSGAAWSVTANTGRYAGQPLGAAAAIAGNVLTVTLDDVGLQFTLALDGSRFLAGDYWLAVMRTRAPDDAGRVRVVSPTPIGVEHRYCVLGVAGTDGSNTVLTGLNDFDLRRLQHPSLTCLDAGDIGYSPKSPCANNFYGAPPPYTVKGALDRICDLNATQVAFSPSCGYLRGNAVTTVGQALEALCVEPAQFVPYDPSCDYLKAKGATNVAAALDALCQRPSLRPLPLVKGVNWTNDRPMTYATFCEGLTVTFSEPIDFAVMSSDVFIVTLECGYSLTERFDEFDELLTPQIVCGRTTLSDDKLSVTFTPFQRNLAKALNKLVGMTVAAGADFTGVRCRVRLPGRAIFSAADGSRALDGFVGMKKVVQRIDFDQLDNLVVDTSGELLAAAPPSPAGAKVRAAAAPGGAGSASQPVVPIVIRPDTVTYIGLDLSNMGMGWVSDFESWFYLFPDQPTVAPGNSAATNAAQQVAQNAAAKQQTPPAATTVAQKVDAAKLTKTTPIKPPPGAPK
jgi:hypothetical protein